MTDEKICPIMSRPDQGDILGLGQVRVWDSEDQMKEYGRTVINGIPFNNIVPCQREKCMAWVPNCIYLNPDGDCACESEEVIQHCYRFETRWHRQYPEHVCEGHCRLIERGA